jgi:hypothetical protein
MKHIYSRKVAFSVIATYSGKEQRQIGMYERSDRLSDPANREQSYTCSLGGIAPYLDFSCALFSNVYRPIGTKLGVSVLHFTWKILANFGIKIFDTKKVIQRRKIEAGGSYITSIVSFNIIVSITENCIFFKMRLQIPKVIAYKRISLFLL